MFITSPEKIVEWFRLEVLGAYRNLTSQDIQDMINCGLIGRYGFYIRQDLETVSVVLQYDQLRQNRIQKFSKEDKAQPPKCKSCGQPLIYQHEAKKGRWREYCQQFESSRVKERYQKWQYGHKAVFERSDESQP
jgi:hypothetical protein